MYYINLISPPTKPFMRYRLKELSFDTIKDARAYCYREIVSKRNAKIGPYDVPIYEISSSEGKVKGEVWMGSGEQTVGAVLWASHGLGKKTYWVHVDGSTTVVKYRRY